LRLSKDLKKIAAPKKCRYFLKLKPDRKQYVVPLVFDIHPRGDIPYGVGECRIVALEILVSQINIHVVDPITNPARNGLPGIFFSFFVGVSLKSVTAT